MEGDFSGKINTAACAANHRKTNSYAAPSPECGIAHREHLTEQEVGHVAAFEHSWSLFR
jgi:hypothetical protein